MAREEPGNTGPLPKFYFSVQLGDGKDVAFQEVTGLQMESKAIEYRHGDSPIFAPSKMPGLAGVGTVTLKKGIFVKDAGFFRWCGEIAMNLITRRTVVISLLDDAGAPKMTWTLNNAWPTKITRTDLESDGDEVAVDSLELAFETLDVKTA